MSNPGRNSSIKPLSNNAIPVPKHKGIAKGNNSYTALKIAEKQINGHESYTATELTLGHAESYSRMASHKMIINSRGSNRGSAESNFETSRRESEV